MDSYNTILSGMKEKYTELSGNEIPEGSDIDIRMKVLAGEIFNSKMNLEFIKRQMFASTAEGSYLDIHARDRGLGRIDAVKSRGEVTFSVNTAREEAIVIPQGTIVGTSGENCVRFLTDNPATLAAGAMSVTVPCTAESGGLEGNVAARAVDIMITNIIGIDSVSNQYRFTGGADAEGDEALRNRVLNTYVSVSNGTNAAYYKKLAESVDGVKSANVVSRARGAGTIDVYIGGYNEQVSSAKRAEVQSLLDEQRELNVNILVSAATAAYLSFGFYIMIKDGYNFDDVSALVRSAVDAYINSLGVGGDVVESHLGRTILSVEGVYDYSWMSNYITSYNVENDEFAVLRSLNIEEDT